MRKVGAKLSKSRSTPGPYRAKTNIWEIKSGAQTWTVTSGSIRAPAVGRFPATHEEVCGIERFAKDAASLAAIRQWVGVAPMQPPPGTPAGDYYNFTIASAGHKRTAPDDASLRAAVLSGNFWMLLLTQDRAGGALRLMHNI